MPGARELLERFIADGFALSVASSAAEDELQPLLERAGGADLIPHRTSSDDAEDSKPDPDIVQAALRKARVEKSSAIMLGDTPYDVEAALRAGIEIVALECGGWSREKLTGAAAVFRDLTDLLVHYDASPFATLRYFLKTVSRFAGFDVRSAAHRSPTFANRAGAVRMVKSCGSTPSKTSFHFSGVETPA